MARPLFSDEEIRSVAQQIAEQQGETALCREAVRAVLAEMAKTKGVGQYRGDTTRIWSITRAVKLEWNHADATKQPPADPADIPLPPALQRLVDIIPDAVRRELAAVHGASEYRAQQVLEAAKQAAEHRERELTARIAALEAEVESACHAADGAEASLDAAEARVQELLARIELCDAERRQLHAVHAAQLEHAQTATLHAQEARQLAERAAQVTVASLREVEGRTEAEQESRERTEAELVRVRDRLERVQAELIRTESERDALTRECSALRGELATGTAGRGQSPRGDGDAAAGSPVRRARGAARTRADRPPAEAAPT